MIRTIYPPVFISFNPEDSQLAFELSRRLQTEGIDSWYDNVRLEPDCNWHRHIAPAANSARIVLPVLTPRWKDFLWTRYETYGAEHVIPLLFEGELSAVATPALPILDAVDLRGSDYPAWKSLFDRIKAYLHKRTPNKTRRLSGRPFARYPFCTGRESLLLDVYEALHSPNGAPTALALTGPDGAGKTAVAREYAEQFRKTYKQVLWVRADSFMPLEYARLAGEMELVQEEADDANEDARLARRELSSATSRLLIIDNAPDEDTVKKWLPKTGGCRTLIISRSVEWSSAVQTMKVDVLDPAEARALLLSIPNLKVTADFTEAAAEVAEELECLPLALCQARGYIERLETNYIDYLDEFRSSKALLTQFSLEGEEYTPTIAASWVTTITQVSQLARSILSLSAFLASAPIPRSLLTAAIPVLKAANKELGDITISDLERALVELSDYSLIRLSPEFFHIHRVSRAIQRDYFVSDELRRLWTEGSVILLSTVFPFDDASQAERCEELLPHARAAAEWIVVHNLENAAASRLLSSMGVYLLNRGLYDDAEAPLRRALEIAEQILGTDHARTADALGNLALLYRKQRKFDLSEPLFLRSIKVCEKTSGPDHPRVATTLSNLALLYKGQKKYASAEPLFVRALEIRKNALGAEHIDTAASLYSLASLYCLMGRNKQAEPLYQEALRIRERHLGPEHPETVGTINNLASLYFLEGKYAEAEPLCVNALRIREKIFGLRHPRTAETMHALAGVYFSQKNFNEASSMYMRALEIRERTLEPEHPDIADTLNNLASLHYSLGNFAKAEPFYRRALAIYESTLGDSHPSTKRVRTNLDHLLKKLGKPQEPSESVAA